jgi:hypothetical protein
MTREEILAMPADRELDALVAEKVMGLTGYEFDDTHWYCPTCKAWVHPAQVTFHEVHERCQTPVVSDWCDEEGNVMPEYSTDISAAWEVVEKIHEKRFLFDASLSVGAGYTVRFYNRDKETFHMAPYIPTAPEAICKAALIAVMEVQAHDL